MSPNRLPSGKRSARPLVSSSRTSLILSPSRMADSLAKMTSWGSIVCSPRASRLKEGGTERPHCLPARGGRYHGVHSRALDGGENAGKEGGAHEAFRQGRVDQRGGARHGRRGGAALRE